MIAGLVGSLVFGLLPLAILFAIVSAFVEARRQAALEDATGEASGDSGIGTVRRLFIYTLALVGLIFAAIGVAMVIAGALDAITGRVLVAERQQGLAVALAFSVVGAPAWLFFVWLAQRSVRDHDVECRSQVRRLYLGLARGVAVAVVAANAITAGRMLAGIEASRGEPWGALVAWGAVWFVHVRFAITEPPSTAATRLLDRFTAYFGALLGLVLLLGGAAGVIAASLSEAYDRTFRGSLISGDWTETLRASLVVMLVGAALWAWHWLRDLVRRDRLTTLWRVQVFLFGALLGVTLAVVPAALLLYAILEWSFGHPGSDTAAAHFASAPAALATLAIGLATWGYHRAVLTEAGVGRERGGPERIYRYLLAGAGLVATATAVSTFIALAGEALGRPVTEFVHLTGWWRNPLMRGVTLFFVGWPLWLRYWIETQRAVAQDIDERGAPSRRVYVFATVGIAIFALLVSLTVLLYQTFRAVLGGELGRALLNDARWAVAVAATTGSIAVYHFLVLREDNAVLLDEAAVVPPRLREVVLVSAVIAPELVAELERLPGVRVRGWRRLDAADTAPLPETQREALVEAVAGEPASRLLVIVTGGSFELVPFTQDAG
ncbi:MAG: hypothetical protein FJ037_04575 [Chloroflexi bacterium]|nr:hypothetical protein [Chloroflexota bacterium]